MTRLARQVLVIDSKGVGALPHNPGTQLNNEALSRSKGSAYAVNLCREAAPQSYDLVLRARYTCG
jgi:hypothetical protein